MVGLVNFITPALKHSHPVPPQPQPAKLSSTQSNPETRTPYLSTHSLTRKLSHSQTLKPENSLLRRLRHGIIIQTYFNPILKVIRFLKTYGFYIAIAI